MRRPLTWLFSGALAFGLVAGCSEPEPPAPESSVPTPPPAKGPSKNADKNANKIHNEP